MLLSVYVTLYGDPAILQQKFDKLNKVFRHYLSYDDDYYYDIYNRMQNYIANLYREKSSGGGYMSKSSARNGKSPTL